MLQPRMCTVSSFGEKASHYERAFQYKLAHAGIESRPDARTAAPWMHRAQTGGLWLVFALDRLCHGLKACKPRSRGDETSRSERADEQSLTTRRMANQ